MWVFSYCDLLLSFQRSLILFLIGICESSIGEIHLEKIQIRGVIQRFALAYLVIASIYLWTLKNKEHRHMIDVQDESYSQTDSSMESSTTSGGAQCATNSTDDDDRLPTMFSGAGAAVAFHDPPQPVSTFLHDFCILWQLWLVVLCLIAIHLFVVFRLPVPGCPTGYMGPGGKQYMGRYGHCMGGATGYIDYLVLGNETSTNINNNNGITAVRIFLLKKKK